MKRSRHNLRRGTTTVEAAFVLPVFFVFLFGIFQFGHAGMVKHLMRNACRSAARMGCTEGVTTANAKARVRDMVGAAIRTNALTIEVKDASVYDEEGDLPEDDADFQSLPDLELATANSRQLFLIRAQVNYNDVAVIRLPWMTNMTLTAEAFMRHE